MRTLEFKVNKQELKKQPGCDFSNLVAGSVGYLRAKFHFSKDWAGCRKVAIFFNDDGEFPVLLNESNACEIPADALVSNWFKVKVEGLRKTEDDILRIKTSEMKVKQEGK